MKNKLILVVTELHVIAEHMNNDLTRYSRFSEVAGPSFYVSFLGQDSLNGALMINMTFDPFLDRDRFMPDVAYWDIGTDGTHKDTLVSYPYVSVEFKHKQLWNVNMMNLSICIVLYIAIIIVLNACITMVINRVCNH